MEVKEELSKHSKEKVMAAGKMRNKFIKIYQNLCRGCRHKVIKTPSLEYNKYCQRCKRLIDNA